MSDLIGRLDALGEDALKGVDQAASLDALESVRINILGKKGALSEVLRGLGGVTAEERPKIGAVANQWKQKIETAITSREQTLQQAELGKKLVAERVDVTLPARLPH